MTKTALTLLLTALLALAGCGGGTEQTAKDSIAESLMDQQSEQDAQMLAVDREDADCIADGMVDGVGVDQLQEYGLLTEDGTVDKTVADVELSHEDAETVTDAVFSCTDVQKMVRQALSKELGKEDQAMRACLEKVLTEDALRAMFVGVFSGESEQASRKLMAPLMNCAVGSMDLGGGTE